MTSDEFDRMVVQGAVQLMMEGERKFLAKNSLAGIIPAKEFEGELWIKASDHYDEVNRSVAAERESCLEACRMYVDLNEPPDGFQNGVECCIAVIKHKDDPDVRARIKAKGQG